MNRILTCAAVAAGLFAGWTSHAEVGDYRNDFTKRTSVGIPADRWLEMPYSLGQLNTRYIYVVPSPFEAFRGSCQDAWFMMSRGPMPEVYSLDVVTDDASSANQYARFYALAGGTYALHSFGTALSNGVLRLVGDIRAPQCGGTVCLAPVYQACMATPNWDGLSTLICGEVGSNGSGPNLFAFGSSSVTGPQIQPGHWYRYETDYDLDAGIMSGRMYDLGTDQPTFASTGEQVATFANIGFFKSMAEGKAVAGLALYGTNAKIETGSVDEPNPAAVASFDNLRALWKPTGGDAFVSFYENDFSVRRMRAPQPGPEEFVYPVATESPGEDVLSDYPACQEPYASDARAILPDRDTSLLAESLPQPIGFDGWRSSNADGHGRVFVATSSGAGRNLLRFATKTGAGFASAVQPLGETITSGKVRLSVDISLPLKWCWSVRHALVALGDRNYYEHDLNAGGGEHYAIEAGVSGTADTTFYPRPSTELPINEMATGLVAQHWYRLVLTADLDTKTVDYELYHLGDSSGPASRETPVPAVYVQNGVAFAKPIGEIASFALMGYGMDASWDNCVCFDNIQIWKNAGTESETQIYFNDFNTRRRPAGTVGTSILASWPNRPMVGVDNWTRQNTGRMDVRVTARDGNPALEFNDSTGYGVNGTSYAYATQDLGQQFDHGRFRARVDVRPPRRWYRSSPYATVLFGDDAYLQGSVATGNFFYDSAVSEFGFTTAEPEPGVDKFYRSPQLFLAGFDEGGAATNWLAGVEIDPSH